VNQAGPPDFQGRQACHGHGDLYASKGRSDAKRDICHRCPYLPECFAWSVEHEPEGFWGGLGPTERRRVRDTYKIRASFDTNGSPRRTLENA
jgi:Transcription factor WhiB